MSTTGRKLAKRACDGCKIRKIKCSEVAPCEGCVAAGIACTFVKQPSTRGPRRLRKSTLREITQSQQQWEDLGFGLSVSEEPVNHTRLDAESVFAPNKVAALVLQLCVYRLRMYPVWPIIKVERLVASLQKPEPDIEVFGLAYAVAAATIVQLRTKPSKQPGAVTAEMMEAQCQFAKVRRNRSQAPDLTTVRIPFFLHMYYENLEPGGLRSITYLREAIAIAHMIGLHRETYYTDVQPEEREIRRRTLWLLFVAERNVSISHRLPVTIRTKIAFPSTTDSDSEHVLAAYQKLVTMFWEFDRSGVFELLDRCDFDLNTVTSKTTPPGLMAALSTMRKRLDASPINVESMEDTQAFDLLITRQWMRLILWRLTQVNDRPIQGLVKEQLIMVKDLLTEIAHYSDNTIEAHSSVFVRSDHLTLQHANFGQEIKIFEITTSVIDTIQELPSETNIDSRLAEEIKEILSRFKGLLSRNQTLDGKLKHYISEVQQKMKLPPTINSVMLFVIEDQSKVIDPPTIESNPSLTASESPASLTGVLIEDPASVSPVSQWSAQQGNQGALLGSPDEMTANPRSLTSQNTLDESFLDMDWTAYEEYPQIRFLGPSAGSWQDTHFAFDGS